MIVGRIPLRKASIYTFPDAMSNGIKKLLLTSLFGKVYIINDDDKLLGYYSFEKWKESGTFDLQLDTVCLQEDEVEDGQTEVYVPLSADGEELGILPIVSAEGQVTGAAVCCPDAWRDDKIRCLDKLEYLSDKNLSLEYWFQANNFGKVALWGLNELSFAFAKEIRRYQSVELLGIYESSDRKRAQTVDYFNYSAEVNFVETIEDVAETGAELVIVTDRAMSFLADYPLMASTKMKVVYVNEILNYSSPFGLWQAYEGAKIFQENDAIRHIYTELFNRYKAKFRALGCNFLTVAVPDNKDLGILKAFDMSKANEIRHTAEWNGWDPDGEEIKEFWNARTSLTSNIIKSGDIIYFRDLESRYINYINKSRVVPNSPAEYKNTVYLIGSCTVVSLYCIDEETLGYYLQENLNARGLEYCVVPIMMMMETDRYYYMRFLEECDIREGDKIFLLDPKTYQAEWDLNLTQVFKELLAKYGDDVYMDQPVHCGKEGVKAIADFLTDHINDPFAAGTASNLQAQAQPSALRSGFTGNPQLKKYQEFIQSNAIHKMPRIGSIVMNCNPFTLGHLHLIEYAAGQVDCLYIFVVEEDKSLFKFEDRLHLVEEGTSHLGNVKVLPSGQFIISSLTFSEYFDKENLDGTTVDSALDVEIFGSQIAPCLDITVRFVGEEPLDPVTAQYNRSMKEILPKYGVELREIPRRELEGKPISASRVRKLLEEKRWEEIGKLVPETTYSFLKENFG